MNRNSSKLTWFLNRNPIFIVRFELDQFWRSNLDGLESESLMIKFVGPNCWSLIYRFDHLNLLFWSFLPSICMILIWKSELWLWFIYKCTHVSKKFYFIPQIEPQWNPKRDALWRTKLTQLERNGMTDVTTNALAAQNLKSSVRWDFFADLS